ncbi:hypothetical protein GCM10008013_14030 [Paenibacillus segetis]|uniref:Uncharacterized protein n=1 Tax=Paenibacillus segetis TaxID=1325360 RepID=A0ABQ1YB79_9BACL|nr:hypothetical protein GCM10008013_14030 [Paenibacillus segetis]
MYFSGIRHGNRGNIHTGHVRIIFFHRKPTFDYYMRLHLPAAWCKLAFMECVLKVGD